MGCRGTSAPAPGAAPLLPSQTLGSAELLFSHIVAALFGCSCAVFFFSVLTMLPGSSDAGSSHYQHHWWAQPWPVAGPSWSWLALALLDIGEPLSSFFTETTPVALPLSKPCHANPIYPYILWCSLKKVWREERLTLSNIDKIDIPLQGFCWGKSLTARLMLPLISLTHTSSDPGALITATFPENVLFIMSLDSSWQSDLHHTESKRSFKSGVEV